MTADGITIRERTVRDYKRDTERAGLRVDMAAIEAMALADCEIGGRALAEQRPHAPAPPDPEMEAARAGELERQVAETGAELLTEQKVSRRSSLLTSKVMPESKWSYAMGRIKRILVEAQVPTQIGTLEYEVERLRAWATLRIPKRYAHLIATRRAKDERNPFDGVSEKDFNRMFQAAIYAICDRSTGKYGPWWVK